MNHKVLLADDSLTIQKVIKITLANQPFDIVDCSSDDELFNKLSEVRPAIVLLDFNLSEKYSGYELTSKIRAAVPSAKVLLLLGTFDTVDDAAMEKCGASDKIVKPFDSNKFIAICKRLVEDSNPDEEIAYPEEKHEEEEYSAAEESEDDQWTVNHTVEHKMSQEPTRPSLDIRSLLNPLDKEVSDWGMSIPGVINDHDPHDKTIDLPPVIDKVVSFADHKNKLEAKEQEFQVPVAKAAPAPQAAPAQPSVVQPSVAQPSVAQPSSAAQPAPLNSDPKFPENNDLDYPTIEELKNSEAPAMEEAPKTKSKLISIETFKSTEEEIEFEIEHKINAMDESDVSSIEAQIRDEVESDLWKVDEFEELKKEVTNKIEEVKNNFQPTINDFDESLFKPLDENEEIPWASDNNDFMSGQQPAANQVQISQEEIEELIKKHVKEYMDKMFQQKVEKIAWEVIPDLAENLIRQEMAKITHKILNESN